MLLERREDTDSQVEIGAYMTVPQTLLISALSPRLLDRCPPVYHRLSRVFNPALEPDCLFSDAFVYVPGRP